MSKWLKIFSPWWRAALWGMTVTMRQKVSGMVITETITGSCRKKSLERDKCWCLDLPLSGFSKEMAMNSASCWLILSLSWANLSAKSASNATDSFACSINASFCLFMISAIGARVGIFCASSLYGIVAKELDSCLTGNVVFASSASGKESRAPLRSIA